MLKYRILQVNSICRDRNKNKWINKRNQYIRINCIRTTKKAVVTVIFFQIRLIFTLLPMKLKKRNLYEKDNKIEEEVFIGNKTNKTLKNNYLEKVVAR